MLAVFLLCRIHCWLQRWSLHLQRETLSLRESAWATGGIANVGHPFSDDVFDARVWRQTSCVLLHLETGIYQGIVVHLEGWEDCPQMQSCSIVLDALTPESSQSTP